MFYTRRGCSVLFQNELPSSQWHQSTTKPGSVFHNFILSLAHTHTYANTQVGVERRHVERRTRGAPVRLPAGAQCCYSILVLFLLELDYHNSYLEHLLYCCRSRQVYDLLAETADEKVLSLSLFLLLSSFKILIVVIADVITIAKARASGLALNITRYIMRNGWQLIDVTGLPTTWGRWDNYSLNYYQPWYDNRGINSLEILSWLVSADRLSGGDPTFMAGFNELFLNYSYGINMINQKITQTTDDNYSDDELAYLPYYTWLHTKSEAAKAEFKASINRSYKINYSEKSSLWLTVYAAYAGHMPSADQRAVKWTLADWTWSLVDWPTQNSERLDIRINPDSGKEGVALQSTTVLPYNERSFFKWNGNPFILDEGSGFSEADPGAWLLPYYMAKYHKFI
jgi:hypothetical protein